MTVAAAWARPRTNGPLFSGPQGASCPTSLALGDRHLACFRCLGAEHAAAALVAPAFCAACRALPEEGLLSRHLFFSPSVDLAEAIDIFRAGVPDPQDADDEHFEVDEVASLDGVFAGSASEFSRSGASTEATVVRGRNHAGWPISSARSWGIPMPAPPLAPMSDDMQGECFRTLSSSRRATQCPLFPPVQHLFTTAGGDPSTLKTPKITGLTDRVFVCASQSAAAFNNNALLSSALVSLSAGRAAYGPDEAARWLTVSRFFSAIHQLCQPIAVSAGRHMAWATMIQRAIWLSHTAVLERERATRLISSGWTFWAPVLGVCGSNSEEAARRDTMTVINPGDVKTQEREIPFLGFDITWEKSFPLPGR
ncbi:unnamed protein product [Boreogadus saida]